MTEIPNNKFLPIAIGTQILRDRTFVGLDPVKVFTPGSDLASLREPLSGRYSASLLRPTI